MVKVSGRDKLNEAVANGAKYAIFSADRQFVMGFITQESAESYLRYSCHRDGGYITNI